MVSCGSARKIKDYIVRSKLYPLKRNAGCWGCVNGRCQVCKNVKVTDTFDNFTFQKSYKTNHKFDCNISAWSTSSAAEHAVSEIRVRLLIVLGGTVIKWKQEKLIMVIRKMLNKSFHKWFSGRCWG